MKQMGLEACLDTSQLMSRALGTGAPITAFPHGEIMQVFEFLFQNTGKIGMGMRVLPNIQSRKNELNSYP